MWKTSWCAVFEFEVPLLFESRLYLGKDVRLCEERVLSVLIDVADWEEGLKELSKLSVLRGLIICCVDLLKEAGRYLRLLRPLDSKTADDVRQNCRGI